MGNTPNQKQKAAALDVFKGNPDISEVHVCSDNQCFVREDSAIAHEKEVLGKYPNPEQMPVLVTRSEEKPMTAAEKIEKIQIAGSDEEIDEIVADDSRKTVLEAAKARKTELSNSSEQNAE